MKWFGVGLLFANLLLFAWYMNTPAKGPAVAHAAAENGAQLVLISELAPSQRPGEREPLVASELPQGADTTSVEDTDEVPLQTDVSNTARCFYISGFADEKIALKFKHAAEKAGANVRPPQSERVSRTRYWVLLPPAASQTQAMTVVEKLRRAGIRDYYLIPNGENRNALSLGVFSSREAAHQRIAEVAGLKLKVRVEEVSFPGKRYTLEVRWPGPPAPAWNGQLPPGVESVSRACEAP